MSNKFGIENFSKDELTIEVKDRSEGNTISVNWIGRVYMIDPSEIIGPYLENVHKIIQDNSLKYINVDFTELRLLNSSGLKAVIKWFKSIGELPEEKKYKIKLVYDGGSDWQITSLSMLNELFPKIIEKIPV